MSSGFLQALDNKALSVQTLREVRETLELPIGLHDRDYFVFAVNNDSEARARERQRAL